ncbi:hypothetical protein OUZ56_019728 [Daphnia magna]|uniref:Uncharacterized protein n=1 Tax=Daphnia magna TaxID=35525 RepID=A0ABQ9ZCG0_9CRUS|nr:hypothetical protein OUZ56_019728 [Daphnia magna]
MWALELRPLRQKRCVITLASSSYTLLAKDRPQSAIDTYPPVLSASLLERDDLFSNYYLRIPRYRSRY